MGRVPDPPLIHADRSRCTWVTGSTSVQSSFPRPRSSRMETRPGASSAASRRCVTSWATDRRSRPGPLPQLRVQMLRQILDVEHRHLTPPLRLHHGGTPEGCQGSGRPRLPPERLRLLMSHLLAQAGAHRSEHYPASHLSSMEPLPGWRRPNSMGHFRAEQPQKAGPERRNRGPDMSKLARRTRLLLALLSALLTPGVVEAQGVLLLAHGGSGDWNREVLALADRIDSSRPVEVAFGMANKRTIQDAVDRLTERGVSGIVAVPLFISSHSSVLRATEYLLGSRDEAPPELQAFARMGARRDSGHADADADADADPSFDRTTRVETTVPISVTTALDGHSLVAEILISRAVDVSRTPEEEIVVLVAHGPQLGGGQRPLARQHGEPGRANAHAHALQPHPVPHSSGTTRRIRFSRRRPRNSAP